DFGIDLDRLHLLAAVDDHRHHPAARVAFDLEVGHLFLQASLHLLRLFHHLLNLLWIHHHISSTSRISAGNASSNACTPASASACSRSVGFLFSPRVEPAPATGPGEASVLAAAGADTGGPSCRTPITAILRPASCCAR